MENVVIGQYIPGESWIYKIDPRVKIICLIFLIVSTFLLPNLYSILGMLALICLIIIFSRISLIRMVKGLRGMLFLLLFTSILQLAYNQKGELLYSSTMHMTLYNLLISIGLLILFIFSKKYIRFKFLYFLILASIALYLQYAFNEGINLFNYKIKIYDDGLNKALFIFTRIVIIIFLSSLLTFTTSPTNINNGLEGVLKPLKVIHVPVGEIAMMLSITLRFIPTLLDETNRIMKAQASRGVDFKESNLKSKVNQIISLLVPMFVISFQRADDLSNAMETRGYVIGEERTKFDELRIRIIDIIVLVLLVSIFASSIYLAIIL